ncbi:hypothetical protein JYU34_017811 [Plutella xylostella]|uniref:DUF4794 domain-containing protein n=1 Tax=Plutella xylostella TaxID=51655 RepID=A0ABQ7Q3F0_PLUXY|nr:hypothetical protein JYU34_017811 [Plutella xylostella]
MKLLILSCVLVGALAELPRYRPARFRLQRQELAPTTTESATEPTTEPAPYPASGWKPSGEPFTLPQETPKDSYGPPQQQNAPYPPSGWQPDGPKLTLPQQAPPSTSYGVPDNSYGAPDTSYGAPDTTYGAPTENPDAETTENPQAEKLEGPVEVQQSAGTYYVLLPNGDLQRVQFMTQNDVQNMAYTARLQLRDRIPFFFANV